MAIVEQTVEIVGGMGGPNANSIPIYGDKNAPHGAWVYDAKGNALMLENTEVSGVQYIRVNPTLLTQEENDRSRFVTWKENGEPYYARIWILNPETGEGEDYAPGVTMWAECTHLKPVLDEEPPVDPPTGEFSIFVIDWEARTVTLKPE